MLTPHALRDLQWLRIPFGEGLVGAAARDKDMINVPDAYADERFNRDVDRETGFSTRSVLCCPILDSYGSTVAVFEAINPLHGGPFGERDVNLCRYMQMQISIALLNARLHQSLHDAKERNESLVR